jgi:phospholipid/cholesterol/gamma-HCH transport system permease protein
MVRIIGKHTLNVCEIFGRFCCFCGNFFIGFCPPYFGKELFHQFRYIGFDSLGIVAMTSLFTGIVLALQTHTGFSRFSAESALPMVVGLSITRELAPVLSGLIVAGRVGSRIAAELGTLRVTEQIDALWTLGVNPMKYLVFPRIIASILMMPCLVIVSDIIGIFGGYLIATTSLEMNGVTYIRNTVDFLTMNDVMSGVIKAFCFGGAIGIMGCYHGFYGTRGAQGVGKSTTKSVVSASFCILLLNSIITAVLFK